MAAYEEISSEVYARATARGNRFGALKAERARFDKRTGRIVISMSTGLDVSFAAKDAQGLASATATQLSGVEVTGGGWTLHVPALDADFSISRLLAGFLGSVDWIKREARMKASQRNGKLGGRPRKAKAA
jgi:hypothetical protein